MVFSCLPAFLVFVEEEGVASSMEWKRWLLRWDMAK